MTEQAAPVAVAPPAAPAAPATSPPVAPVAAPAPGTTSLLPSTPVAAPVAPAAPAAPVDPNSASAWVLAEGVMGAGEKPAWFKSDKYVNVSEQAKAYTELEKRFGSFTGAPKDGAYQFTAPEGLTVQFDDKHPMVPDFTNWAKDNQLSQKGYGELLGMLARYEEAQIPNMEEVKGRIGQNADSRIQAISQWAGANLEKQQYDNLVSACGGLNAAEVLLAVEAIIGKTKQVPMPKPGQDVPSAQGLTEASIRAEQAKVGADGKRLWDTDPLHRVKVEKMRVDFYSSQR